MIFSQLKVGSFFEFKGGLFEKVDNVHHNCKVIIGTERFVEGEYYTGQYDEVIYLGDTIEEAKAALI